jgi:hypothetical protein
MSAFPRLLEELTFATVQRFERPVPRHWREDPGVPLDSPTRWCAWLEGIDGCVAFGRSGEDCLRNLLALVLARRAKCNEGVPPC